MHLGRKEQIGIDNSFIVLPAGIFPESVIVGYTIKKDKANHWKKYVDVILPLPLPRCFTYSLPDEGAEEVQIGCRVVVPFGRKKYYTAIVRNVHHYAPTEYEVKEISTVLDCSALAWLLTA